MTKKTSKKSKIDVALKNITKDMELELSLSSDPPNKNTSIKIIKDTKWDKIAKNAYNIATEINKEIGGHTHDNVIEIIDFINCRVMDKKCLILTRALHLKGQKPMELK